jgi:hypothetical protein
MLITIDYTRFRSLHSYRVTLDSLIPTGIDFYHADSWCCTTLCAVLYLEPGLIIFSALSSVPQCVVGPFVKISHHIFWPPEFSEVD